MSYLTWMPDSMRYNIFNIHSACVLQDNKQDKLEMLIIS